MYIHRKSQAEILREGSPPLPQRQKCGMHMPMAKLIWHQRTDRRNQETDMRLWRQDVDLSQRAGDMKFSLHVREEYPLVEGV